MSAGVSTLTMDRKWVTQCALSRICGVCARPLGRPIAFVGTAEEVGRNAFHLAPMHLDCAQGVVDDSTQVVTTAAFEFVRPGNDDLDKRPRFEPNSLL